jgi:hypothetical protein
LTRECSDSKSGGLLWSRFPLMLTPSRRSAVEVLESRIAPAAYYVSGTSLAFHTASGAVQAGDHGSEAAAGVDGALLLHAGDRIVFDPDGVVSTHQSDYPWVTVVAGDAVVFFKDFNGDQRYSLDELSGLAVGDGFSGNVFTDIHGSVATMLAPNGLFTPQQLQHASISRLTISGALVSAVDGYTNILAGRDLANLNVIGQALPGGSSVNGVVATGNAALGVPWGFGGPQKFFDPALFQPAPGANGGDVTNAHFTGGLAGIFAGDGVSSDSGQAGHGGSVVNVTIGISPKAFELKTGAGGNSEAGRGGAGGSILGFRGSFHSAPDAALHFSTGGGGYGVNGDGGAGGAIANSSFRGLDPALSFTLQTGEGGPASGRGAGGAGGGIVNTSALLLGDLGSALVQAGGGGKSASAVGGAGGSIAGGGFRFLGALGGGGAGEFKVLAGKGGNGATGGGAGGALQQLVFDFQKTVTVTGEFSFRGGLGGEDQGRLGAGGNGGAIDGLAILSRGELAAKLIISAGAGGPAGTEAALPLGAGGAGGGLSHLLLQAPKLQGLSLATGDGGESTGLGRGGRGGDFSTGLGFVPHPLVDPDLEARLQTPGGVYVSAPLATFDIKIGKGGPGGDGNGDPSQDDARIQGGSGGAGGSLFNSTFDLGGLSSELLVAGGGGGPSRNNGTGGLAGRIDHASFHVRGATGGVRISLGAGGSAEDEGHAGGGRSYSCLDLVVDGAIAGTVFIHAPAAGEGGYASTPVTGAAGGAIDHLHFEAGDILGASPAPSGLSLSGAYSLQITATNGQDGSPGGAGGGITNSSITAGALTGGAFLIAGDGGFSVTGSGALGGSISSDLIHFRGDLGGNLQVRAGHGGIGPAVGGPLSGRGGAVSATGIALEGAHDVSIRAGDAGLAFLPAGQSGGAIDRLTLTNRGLVGKVAIVAGVGEGPTLARSGPGGAVSRSSYSNLGGAASILVSGGDGGAAGDLPGFPPESTAGGAGGALTDFVFNNAAPFQSAAFGGGGGGSVSNEVSGSAGNGGAGGAVTRFVLHDSIASNGLVEIDGGGGGSGDGRTGRGGAGGPVLGTRLDSLGDVIVYGGWAGEVTQGGAPSVGGAGGAVIGLTGQVGHLSVHGGSAGAAHVGGTGGSVSGVNLSEVTGFVRTIAGGGGGDGTVPGAGGSVSSIVVPGDIGDFHAAFGHGMGGLIGGAGGQGDIGPDGRTGRVSSITANRIAAIFAATAGGGFTAVASITAVHADVIGADTGLPGAFEVPSPRGYGTYTSADANTPIDGPVIVRTSGYNAQSLSATPLFLILAPG